MADLFDMLNKNAGALTVLFTAAVAISTIFYAVLTGRLVSETRRMREVQTEPKIHIAIDNHERALNIIFLRITNIGLGPARNVRFRPSVVSGGQPAERLLEELTNSNFFKVGLRHFGPGETKKSTYSQLIQDYEGKIESVLSFELHYESVTGKRYEEERIVDMSEHKDNYRIGIPDLTSIAKSLEAIQRDTSDIGALAKRVNLQKFFNENE